MDHLGIDLTEKSWTRRISEVCPLQLSSVSSLVVQNLDRIPSSSNCLGEAVWVGMNHLLDTALPYTDVLQDCVCPSKQMDSCNGSTSILYVESKCRDRLVPSQ